MWKFPKFRRPRPGVLLGLGLLGPLLWGQCTFRLGDDGRRYEPQTNLHLKITVGVAHLDSFSTRGPEHAYAGVALQNRSNRPCHVGQVDGVLSINGRLIGDGASYRATSTLLPAHSEHVFNVDLMPFPASRYGKGTDFKALHTAWQKGQPAWNQVEVRVTYTYYLDEGDARNEFNSRIETVPLVR